MAVREALARCHGGVVTPQQPPKGEHQANGVAEEAGRTIRDHARVLKINLQAKVGRKIEPDEPIMPWLIRWAAMALSRYSRGKDGKTPYQRQIGRSCDIEVVPFGEIVLYRLPEVARDRHQALEERWVKGIWLGHARNSPEHMIGTSEGVRKVFAVRRLAEGEQWNGDMIKSIKGSPKEWELDAGEEPQML